jgi:SOS-response transcriptional repressor LexA
MDTLEELKQFVSEFPSTRQAARALGIDASNLYDYINGKRNPGNTLRMRMQVARQRISEMIEAGGRELAIDSKFNPSVESKSIVKESSPKYSHAKYSPEIATIRIGAVGAHDVLTPVYESGVSAGLPSTPLTDTSQLFNVTKHYSNTITVVVNGDSMKDAGMLNGDRIIIRLQSSFMDGKSFWHGSTTNSR